MYCTACEKPILDDKRFCENCGAPTNREAVPIAPDFSRTDATRLLSAACYLNPLFRTEVYEKYVETRHKAIAPSYGLDLATVVRHCIDARHLAFIRNLCIAGLLVLCLLIMQAQFGFGLVLLLAGLFFISFAWEWQAFKLVRKHLTRRNFEPNRLGERYKEEVANLSGTGNLVVYSGFNPFIGSGVMLNSWNFAVDLRKGKQFAGIQAEPKNFTIPELYDEVGLAIHALGLHNCSVEDRVHVCGTDVRDDTRFLPHPLARPLNSVDSRVIHESLVQPSMRVRHYRWVRVVDWSGELVLSFFFRFAICGHNLFMEASTHLLTPIEELNRTVEHIYTQLSLLQVGKRLVYAALSSFIYVWWSPLNVVYRLIHPVYKLIRHWLEDWILSENPAFDYGAASSLRETACGSFLYRRHGQKLDGDMSQKVVEQTALNSLVQFLDEHDIDTSDLKERETTLLNNGVIMSGGRINAGSLSVGKGARSILQKITRSRKRQQQLEWRLRKRLR